MALFGIRYYCFSLHVIKGQLVPLSSSYSGSIMSLPPCLFWLLASCILFLILDFLTAFQKADPESSHSVSGKYSLLLPSPCTPASGSKSIPSFCTAPSRLLKDGVGVSYNHFLQNHFPTCQPKWNMHFGKMCEESLCIFTNRVFRMCTIIKNGKYTLGLKLCFFFFSWWSESLSHAIFNAFCKE